VLCGANGYEVTAGLLTATLGRSSATMKCVECTGPLLDATSVDVILRPDVEAAELLEGDVEPWPGEIVFEDIQVD
jgi:hypothetical protein